MKVAFLSARDPGFSGLFGVLVKWWTRGDFWHCELVASEQAGVASTLSSALRDGGVRAAKVVLNSGWIVVDVETTVEQEAEALEWFARHMGQPYDVRGLFGFVVRRIKGDKGRWFCSEAVAAALGFPEPWRLDPNTFHAVLTRRCEAQQELAT